MGVPTNYSELQTEIASYLHRSDLTSMIPSFIGYAESRLNRRLRLRAMEQIDSGTVAQSVSLPTGYLEMRSMTISSGTTYYPIPYIPPASLTEDTGAPTAYSIVGDSIYFNPYSSSYSYKMVYYKKMDSVSLGTNWLIENAPEAYLYASLLEASPYIQDDPRLQVWAAQLEDTLAQLNKADIADRFGSSLVVKAA